MSVTVSVFLDRPSVGLGLKLTRVWLVDDLSSLTCSCSTYRLPFKHSVKRVRNLCNLPNQLTMVVVLIPLHSETSRIHLPDNRQGLVYNLALVFLFLQVATL